MKAVDFIDAITWAVDANLIKYPENYADIVANETVSQNAWQSIEWTGGEVKPSWNDILEWYLEIRLRRLIYPQEGAWERSNLKGIRNDLIKQLNRDKTGLHIGTSATMNNLHLMLNKTGKIHIELRGVDGDVVIINTKKWLKKVLDAAVENENAVLNAHNNIMAEFHRLLETAKTADLSASDRISAAKEAGKINENYAKMLETHVNK